MSRTRKRLRGVLAVATAAVAVAATAVFTIDANAAVPAAPAGMTTVFSDDFTGAAGTGLNTANWLYDIGTGYAGGAANWGTGEVETMTNSTANVYQDGGGNLVIKPVRDSAGNWTSGRVETQRTMAFLQHLRVERELAREVVVLAAETQRAFQPRDQFTNSHGAHSLLNRRDRRPGELLRKGFLIACPPARSLLLGPQGAGGIDPQRPAESRIGLITRLPPPSW